MSGRALFFNSSPVLGNGSFGLLPVTYEDPELHESDSDENEGGTSTRVHLKGKGRGRHRYSDTAQETSAVWAGKRRRRLTQSTSPRTALRRKPSELSEYGGISRALDPTKDGTLEAQQDSGLEGQSRGSGGMALADGMGQRAWTPSSSSSSVIENSEVSEAETEDADKVSDKSNYESDPPDNSPYPQVRASVQATDDITLSISTPRMWTLSLLFGLLGSSTNLFFSLRYPSVSITPLIALLLVHPIGLLWDQLLKCSNDPDELFVNGTMHVRASRWASEEHQHLQAAGGSSHQAAESISSWKSSTWKRRLRLWLGQGRWNEKEHACVYISSNVSFGFAFATDVIVEQSQFYHQNLTVMYQILLTLSTQILGYAIAGLTRRYLVRPSGMIWPSTLISTSMFRTLHKEDNKPADGWLISRWKFFLYTFLGSCVFYLLPGLLMPALSYFSIITWFAPKSVVVANLFGIASGLGMFPATFDWAQIAYIGSPLVVPFWAAVNIVGGLIVVMWFIAPILYYRNVMFSSYLPILSSSVFDNTGKPYDVSRILTPDFLFDEEAYKRYSRVFLPITYALSYALQFAALSALLTHTACWHGKDIWKQWRHSWEEVRSAGKPAYQPVFSVERNASFPRVTVNRASFDSRRGSAPSLDNLMGVEDVHNRLMRRYDDVPVSWYLLTGLVMAAVGIFVVEYYPIHLPWYGLLLALAICTVLFVPIGIVMAITNQQSSLYLICQLICGIVFPGRPVANMVFVTYGYITSTQGLKFSSDLKLGHYMKIPPRLLFKVQMAATILSSLTQIGVLNWMLSHIPGICTPEAINGFTCPIARVHFNGSVFWGLIGPHRVFGPGAIYRPLIWAFLVGAITPIGVYLAGRRHKHSIWRKVNLPVVFGSLSWIPPATGLNFSVWALVCWMFNYMIKRRKGEWWAKYNMILSAALDSGLAVGVVVVFFGVVYPGWMEGFSWWGTEVYKQGCDWQACAYRSVSPGQTFGPKNW